MRKQLTLTVALCVCLPAIARAQALGCYVTLDEPTKCSFQQIECDPNPKYNLQYFGSPIADLCNEKEALHEQLERLKKQFADEPDESEEDEPAIEASRIIKSISRRIRAARVACKRKNRR